MAHHNLSMLWQKAHLRLWLAVLLPAFLLSGCISPKQTRATRTLLKVEDASQTQMMAEVNRFARVGSMKAKMDLKFEDNSFAQFGSKEVYRAADGEVVVQRPANIRLTVKVPVIKTDVAQMTSDGTKFRVAVLQDGGSGKYKKFVMGSNEADYSVLQKELSRSDGDGAIKQNVNAFANLRPQHFTDAMLVRPTDGQHTYTVSTIYEDEEDLGQKEKSPLRLVTRGYYLLDEYARAADGTLTISRRFWFDRVAGLRLAKQQLFDSKGELESDIVYGREGNLSDGTEYANLPLRIQVTRIRDKYTMSLTYQMPEEVVIGKTYPATAFVLQNSWGLEEVNLDDKLREAQATVPANSNQNTTTRIQ